LGTTSGTTLETISGTSVVRVVESRGGFIDIGVDGLLLLIPGGTLG
jgi:hypothetical protein